MNVVITMAGTGRRFTEAGYRGPKYALEAHGHSLFWWSLVSLSRVARGAHHAFVVRRDDQAHGFIARECAGLGIAEFEVIELDGVTDGQATTALIGVDRLPDPGPFAIFNIDTHVAPGAIALPPPGAPDAGHVTCFPADGTHWSFVRPGPDFTALELREKVRISDLATIGLYWFGTREIYREAYSLQQALGKEAGEMYVAPLYNRLIERGLRVSYSVIAPEAVHVLGTPEELERFKTVRRESIGLT